LISNYQQVAECASARKVTHMARVQHVEAAIGQNNLAPFAFSAVIRETRAARSRIGAASIFCFVGRTGIPACPSFLFVIG